jgi:hypothetical protein
MSHRRNFDKEHRRNQIWQARTAEYDAARYISEHGLQRAIDIPSAPLAVQCTCGHQASINPAEAKIFKCSQCGKRYRVA